MKKILKVLLTIILCFCFISDIKAADPIYTTVYRNKYTKSSDQPNLMFSIYQRAADHNVLHASPMNTFTYQNETKGPTDSWDSGGGDNSIKLVINGKKEKIDFDYKGFYNKNYLYYDNVKDGFFRGNNKLYLSDKELDKNDIDYDIMLEKIPQYKKSNPNAILEEMLCTYGPGKDQDLKSQYKFISIGMIRNKNTIKYQVYLDFNPVFDDYKTISEDYKGYDKKIDIDLGNYDIDLYLKDHFSPRNFWNEETGLYGCPSGIVMGYKSTSVSYAGSDSLPGFTSTGSETAEMEIGWKEVMDKEYTNSTYSSSFFTIENLYEYDLSLYENSSYVEYTQGEENTQICIYSSEVCDPTVKDCDDKWEVSLKENYYSNGTSSYDFFHKTNVQFDNVYFEMSPGLIKETCDDLTDIYTNCLNGDRSHKYYSSYGYGPAYTSAKLDKNTCIVSTTEFTGSEKYTSNKYLNEFDIDTVEQSMGESNGLKYKQLICELKPMLGKLSTTEKLNKTTSLDIYSNKSEFQGSYNITQLPCSEWGTEYNFECDSKCEDELEYRTNKEIREIFYHCNEVYKGYLDKGANLDFMKGRYLECKKFEEFYDSLVQNGIVYSIFIGCDFISNDLREKLELILDVIKIVGPVLAIVLGMWDFTKVLFTGDADKEMKTAGKRFITRIIAAALLFLIPALISIPLNVVLEDKVEGSPLCGLDKRE